MDRCPLCRATLNGADTCRRCRAELGSAQRVERAGQSLVGAAMHHLALDDRDTAMLLLRRALTVHATPEARTLWALASRADSNPGDEETRL